MGFFNKVRSTLSQVPLPEEASLLKTHGGGISSTTTTTLFTSHTKSPAAKNGPEAPLGPIPRSNLEVPEIHKGSAGNTQRATLSPKTQSSEEVQRLANRNGYLDYLGSDHFPNPTNDPAETAAMNNVLKPALAKLADELLGKENPDEHIGVLKSPTLGAPMQVLTELLAKSVEGSPNPAQDAARALLCLRNIDLRASLVSPTNATLAAVQNNPHAGVNGQETHTFHQADGTPANFTAQDLSNAWRLAYNLFDAGGARGFASLKKITANPPVPADANEKAKQAAIAERNDDCLVAYLRGAVQLHEEHAAAQPTAARLPLDPASVFGHISGTGTSTLAGKGLKATKFHIDQTEAFLTGTANAFVPQKHEHEWAFALLNNNWRDDRIVDDNGKRTKFGQLEENVRKMKKGADIATGNDARTTASRIEREFLQRTIPGHPGVRSPFNTYNNRGPDKNHAMGFRNAEDSGIRQARHFKQGVSPAPGVMPQQGLMGNLIKGIKTNGGGTAAAPAPIPLGANGSPSLPASGPGAPDKRTLVNLVRLAILDEINTTKLLPRYGKGQKLDDDQLNEAKKRLNAWLVDPAGGNAGGVDNLAGPNGENKALVDAIFELENQPQVPETMARWAFDVGAPANIMDKIPEGMQPPPAAAAGQPDWHSFRTSFAHIRHREIDRADDTHLNRMRPDVEQVSSAVMEAVTNVMQRRGASEDEQRKAVIRGVQKAVEGSGTIEKRFKKISSSVLDKVGGNATATAAPAAATAKPSFMDKMKAKAKGKSEEIAASDAADRGGKAHPVGKNAVKIAAAALNVAPPTKSETKAANAAAITAAIHSVATAIANGGEGKVDPVALATAAVGTANAGNADLIEVTAAVLRARLEGTTGNAVRETVRKDGHNIYLQEVAAAVAALGGDNKDAVAEAMMTAMPAVLSAISAAASSSPTAARAGASSRPQVVAESAVFHGKTLPTNPTVARQILNITSDANGLRTSATQMKARMSNAEFKITEKAVKATATNALRNAKEEGRLQGMQEAFGKGFRNMELGSGIELAQGGIISGGIEGFTSTIVNTFSMGFGNAKSLARQEYTPAAYFNAQVTTSGVEMVSGTQTLHTHKNGAGGGGGWNAKLGKIFLVGVRGGMDVPYTYDNRTIKGSMMRYARPGVLVDDQTTQKIDRKFGQVINPNGKPSGSGEYTPIASPTDRQSKVKQMLQDDPTLSIGLMESHESTHRLGVKGYVYGGVKVLEANTGFLKAGLGVESVLKGQQFWVEEGGRYRAEKVVQSWGTKATAEGVLADLAAAFTVKSPEESAAALAKLTAADKEVLQVLQGIPGFSLYSKSVDFWQDKGFLKDTLIYKHDELLPNTFRVKTHSMPASYVKAMQPRINIWCVEKLKKFNPELYFGPERARKAADEEEKAIQARGGKETPAQEQARKQRNADVIAKAEARKDAALKREQQEQLRHLREVMEQAEPTQGFQEYFELKREPISGDGRSPFEEAQDLISSIAAAKKTGNAKKEKELSKRLNELRSDQASWVETFLVDLDTESENMFKGWPIFAKAGKIESAKTSQIRRFD